MSIKQTEKPDVLFHLGVDQKTTACLAMDQKPTACLALLGQLRGAGCSFTSTSSPAPHSLRVCSGAAAGAVEVPGRFRLQVVGLRCLQQAQQGVVGTGPPLCPACSSRRRAQLWSGTQDMGWRAGPCHRCKQQGWGQQGHEKHWAGLTAISWWPTQAAAAPVDGSG